jgi:putative N-acetylmannosamine-6-phosphate epimerase
MLTYNDVTVKDAYDVFGSSWDLDVRYWGFKNVGLPKEEMRQVVNAMRDKGKTTFLEVVTYDEASCLEGAKTAVECGFDQIMGTLYYPAVHKYLKDNKVTYKPFVGKVSGSPSILEGSYTEIIDDAKELLSKGITGFDILAYRHVEDGENLARLFCEEVDAEICIAGSISSFERIDVMFDIGPWGFTMGSALFDKKFVSRGTFRENLQVVVDYIKAK